MQTKWPQTCIIKRWWLQEQCYITELPKHALLLFINYFANNHTGSLVPAPSQLLWEQILRNIPSGPLICCHTLQGVPLSQQEEHTVAFHTSPSFSPFSSAAVQRQQMSWAGLSWAVPGSTAIFLVWKGLKPSLKVGNAHSSFPNQKMMTNSNEVCVLEKAVWADISLSRVWVFLMGVVSRLAHCYRDVLFQRGSFHLQFF